MSYKKTGVDGLRVSCWGCSGTERFQPKIRNQYHPGRNKPAKNSECEPGGGDITTTQADHENN